MRISGRLAAFVLIGTLSLFGLGTGSAQADMPQLYEREHLRVCADGNNLPFTNREGEGFENRIAEMMAKELGKPLSYVWAPQIMGFVRNTLDLRVCDVMIGVAAGYDFVQNTNAYYRSVYALILPADSDIAATTLNDPDLKDRNIGVVAGTPPMIPLRQAGASVHGYPLLVDTRVRTPVKDAVEDVATGVTEGAVIWGPIAGYYANRQQPALKVVPLLDNAGDAQLEYRITMGVRRGETQWRDWINDFIERRQDDINAILADYHVPLLDSHGQLIDPTTMDAAQ